MCFLIRATGIKDTQYLAIKKGKHLGTCMTERVVAPMRNTEHNLLPTEKSENFGQGELAMNRTTKPLSKP